MYNNADKQRIRNVSELAEDDQFYLRGEWDRLCARQTNNTSEYIFAQKPNGLFFKAIRERIAPCRYTGSAGGYWSIRFGTCRCFKLAKTPLGGYTPEPADKYFSGYKRNDGEVIPVPSTVHTKKEALALAKNLGFEIE